MFVGNGLDRSGIGVYTAMLYKSRIEYNTLRLEPEQASRFPTNQQPRYEYFLIQRAACGSTATSLSTLNSQLSTLNSIINIEVSEC